jgi:hypothetical protein
VENGEENQLGQVLPPGQVLVPFMSKKRFAELSGLEFGVVDAWVDRGYLPSKVFGKHRLINVALLWRKAFEDQYS